MKRPRGRPKGSKKTPTPLPLRPSAVVSIVEAGPWPEVLPVTQQILRVVETHLAEDLDELLGSLP